MDLRDPTCELQAYKRIFGMVRMVACEQDLSPQQVVRVLAIMAVNVATAAEDLSYARIVFDVAVEDAEANPADYGSRGT